MEEYTDIDCSHSNFSNMSCFEFGEHSFILVSWLKTGLSILAAVMCIMAILLIVILKAYKRFVHRLVLYLCLVAFFSAINRAIELEPVKHWCGHVVVIHSKTCIVFATSNQYSNWAILVLTTWIGLHLFILAVFNKDYRNTRKYEICIILTTVIVPILFCIIPLFHIQKVKMYGLAGAWCWIKSTDEECREIKAGIIEQFLLWYAPVVFLVLVFFLITVIVIIAILVKKRRAADEQHVQDQFSRSLKEMQPLPFYPVIFSILYGLAFTNRVYYAVTKKAILGLWITHSIVSPLFSLIIPLAFFLHPNIRKRLNYHEFKKAINNWRYSNAETYFSVSKEDEEESIKLIIRGRQADSAVVSSFLNIPK